MTAIIAAAAVLGYITPALFAARWWFRAICPYTEPVACTRPRLCAGDHLAQCYRRPGHSVDSRAEAMIFALLTGMVWPLILPARGAARFVMSGGQPPEELAAEIKRLEHENERLRRQQDRGWL
jgi:hypothetical protein